jgi:hypothetical protein
MLESIIFSLSKFDIALAAIAIVAYAIWKMPKIGPHATVLPEDRLFRFIAHKWVGSPTDKNIFYPNYFTKIQAIRKPPVKKQGYFPVPKKYTNMDDLEMSEFKDKLTTEMARIDSNDENEVPRTLQLQDHWGVRPPLEVDFVGLRQSEQPNHAEQPFRVV